MATALFVTRNDVVKHTTLSGNLDADLFIQYIKIAQDIHIQNYLGTKLYELIEGYVSAGTLGNHADELALVTDHLKPMLIHWAMVEYLPFAAYTVSNKGVFKHSSENAQNVEKNEVDFLIEKERSIAQYYTDRFIDFMSFNAASKFPTYYTNNNDNVYPDKESDFAGWVL